MSSSSLSSTRPDAPTPLVLPFAAPVGTGASASLDHAAEVGRLVTKAWAAGAHPAGSLLSQRSVFAIVADRADEALGLDAEVGLVSSHLATQVDLDAQGWQRLATEIGRFHQFATAREVTGLDAVSPVLAREFIEQPIRDVSWAWADPKVATQRTRRGGVRLLYRTARFLGLTQLDPTIDIHFPQQGRGNTRPLTDDEVYLGRSWSQLTLASTRHPAAWAMAEASAMNSELAAAIVGDVDLEASQVWLHGNERWREPRLASLSPWGVAAVARHLDALGTAAGGVPDPERTLLTDATSSRNCRQSSTNQLIATTLGAAGLRTDKTVKPTSVCFWAGRRVLEETGRIERAAQAMGIRDLGRAAEAVRFEW